MSDDKFSIATHLYMRLRRSGGRVIDVMWMLRDEKYAREIVDFARGSTDPETRRFAERYADLLSGGGRKPAPAPPPRPVLPSVRAAPAEAPVLPDATAAEDEVERLQSARYRGGLR